MRKKTASTVSTTTYDDLATISTYTSAGRDREWRKFVHRGSNRKWSRGQQQEHQRRRNRGNRNNTRSSIAGLAGIIVVFGLIAGVVFAMIFLRAENRSRRNEFESGASVTVAKIGDSFDEYADVASLIHGRCRHRPRFNATSFERNQTSYTEYYNAWSESFRRDFRELYEYIDASGLEFKAMQFDPNISALERPNAESEAGAFYGEHYPEVDYTGFRGFNGDATSLEPRWRNQSFYFPIHYMEPIRGNEAAIDLDYYSSESRIRAVNALFRTKRPSLTDRLSLVKHEGQVSRCSSGNDDTSYSGPSFGVVLMHPGVRLSEDDETSWPRDFSSIVLCISDLMKRAAIHQNQKVSVYIHDLSHPKEIDPVFMGAARLDCNSTYSSDENRNHHDGTAMVQSASSFHLLEEVSLYDLDCDDDISCYQKTISIANRKWTVTVLNEEGPDRIQMVVVAMIGLFVFAAFVGLAVWVVANDRRNRVYAKLKSRAAAERNALVLENANKAAQTERELNDFLAHEVRNPLAAAMAATQFLRTELDRRSRSIRGIGDHFHDANTDAEINMDIDMGEDSDDDDDDDGEEQRNAGVASFSVEKDIDEDENDCSGAADDNDGLVSSLTRAALHSSGRTESSPRLVQAREDIRVVDHALHFINDLLRNMLDMNRAASKKLKVKFAPADLLQDVLQPIAGMLHRGGENIGGGNGVNSKVRIIVDCPENIIVNTDVLRLKQVILNLSRNSVKFIDEGFIRLRAEVLERDGDDDLSIDLSSNDFDIEANTMKSLDSTVKIYVEDSGSGIPIEKQENLFNKYQESLDLLGQGTGIGLHLCKTLIDLMDGEISLDPTYCSGIPGYPGARFVIDLRSSPIGSSVFTPYVDGVRICENDDECIENDTGGDTECKKVDTSETTNTNQKQNQDKGSTTTLPELPKHLKVLFIDDDRILRKLFARTMKTVAPEWTIREAANGETAILLAEEEEFDLIFCDMYMASVEKQLLGTETVAELRANGITSRICGLSANDKETEFLEAGSDAFLFKPIPCGKKALRETLQQVLYG